MVVAEIPSAYLQTSSGKEDIDTLCAKMFGPFPRPFKKPIAKFNHSEFGSAFEF